MPLSGRHRGWDWDPGNSRLNVVIDGTIVAYFDDATNDLTLANANGISGISSGDVGFTDNALLEMGTNADTVLLNRSAELTANATLTGVTVGTPVFATVPPNSLMISNITQDGDIVLITRNAGAAHSIEMLRLDASAGVVHINAGSADVDFIVETDTQTHALFVQGGTNRVGILNDTPLVELDITGAVTASGIIKTDSTQTATTTTDGSLQTDGGLSVAGTTFAGGEISADGGVLLSNGGVETQITSKATGVTLNAHSGQITMHNASLASGIEVSFTLTNSVIGALDIVLVNHGSGGTAGSYLVQANNLGAGSCSITVSNASSGSLAEAIVLNFAVFGGASS